MTPMEQLDIIKGCEAVEAMDEDEPNPRDLEVYTQHIRTHVPPSSSAHTWEVCTLH